MWWLLHCNTGCLKEHKPSVPCFVLLSKNFVIIKACSKNIMGSTDLVYTKKVRLKVPVRLSFQGLPSFLDTEKSAKCSYFATACCFIHPPLIFATESLIISLQHIITLCISLLSQSLWIVVLSNVMKDLLLIVGVILHRWSIKTLILSSLRR